MGKGPLLEDLGLDRAFQLNDFAQKLIIHSRSSKKIKLQSFIGSVHSQEEIKRKSVIDFKRIERGHSSILPVLTCVAENAPEKRWFSQGNVVICGS